MKAAVFHGPHQALSIEEVDIDKPMGREVLVRTVASGVCHSDLHFVDGFYPFPTPAILGHEASIAALRTTPHNPVQHHPPLIDGRPADNQAPSGVRILS